MRQPQFDLLKGIGIILVLIGHADCSRLVFCDLYLFHMPLFFLASGCFFKRREDESFKARLRKQAKRLLVPYLAFLGISIFCHALEAIIWPGENGVWATLRTKAILFGIGLIGMEQSLSFRTIWFLIALFEVSILYWGLSAIRDLRGRTAISLLLFIGGYLLQSFRIDLPFFIDSALSLQLYYHLGYLFRAKGFSEIRLSPWVCVVGLTIILVLFNQAPVYTDYRTNRFHLSTVPMTLLIVWQLYGLCLAWVNSRWKNAASYRFLERAGVNSLLIFGIHRNFYLLLQPLFFLLPIGTYRISVLLVIIAILGSLSLAQPIEKRCPWMLGKS